MVKCSGRKNAPDRSPYNTTSYHPRSFRIFRPCTSNSNLAPTRVSLCPGNTWVSSCLRDNYHWIRPIHLDRSQERTLEIRIGIWRDTLGFFVLLPEFSLQPGRNLIGELLIHLRSWSPSSCRPSSNVHVLKNRALPNSKTEHLSHALNGGRADHRRIARIEL